MPGASCRVTNVSRKLSDSVRQLTAAIASGDSEAFARFFRERFDRMYAEARRVTGRNESFCLDVVQDAMIRTIRSMKPMDTERHLWAWLRVVVQSCAYDRLRKEARQRRWEEAAVGAGQTASSDDGLGEKLAWLRKELEGMTDPQVRLLVLRYRLGWTLRGIGEALGLKPGTVDGRLGRLVAGLRRRAQETSDE